MLRNGKRITQLALVLAVASCANVTEGADPAGPASVPQAASGPTTAGATTQSDDIVLEVPRDGLGYQLATAGRYPRSSIVVIPMAGPCLSDTSRSIALAATGVSRWRDT